MIALNLKRAIASMVIALFFCNAYAQNRPSVIIIGAGVSGLSAAQELIRNDIHPLILEARNRIGGRIQTIDRWGVAIDLGAAWIHGVNHNPFMEMAEKLHIKVMPSVYNDNDELRLFTTFALYDQSGERLSDERVARQVDYLKGFEDYLLQNRRELYRLSLHQALLKYENLHHIISSEDYLINYLLRISYTFEFAADPIRLAAEADIPYEGSIVSGENVFPVGGYARFLPALSYGLNIRLNQNVSRIEYGSRGVDVYTQNKRYHADYIIITVPLGVLKAGKIKFVPALPASKMRAIKQLGMGVYDKIILHFDHTFWDEDKEWIGMLPSVNHPENIFEVMNLGKFTGQPDLMIFTADQFAKKVETWSDKKTIAAVMRMLRKLYGSAIPDPTDYIITRWNNDPYSLGSYSYLPMNVPFDVSHRLSLPVKSKLFFAGEATSSTDMATVHGAYQTGIRAADQIVSVLH